MFCQQELDSIGEKVTMVIIKESVIAAFTVQWYLRYCCFTLYFQQEKTVAALQYPLKMYLMSTTLHEKYMDDVINVNCYPSLSAVLESYSFGLNSY